MELGTFGLAARRLVAATDTLYLAPVPEAKDAHGILNLGDGLFDGLSSGRFAGSTSGTVLAINAQGGYGGNLLDLQVGGVSKHTVSAAGASTSAGVVQGTALTAQGLTGATAASRYVGATASGAPLSGTFSTGDFIIDQTGSLRICTAGGSPGTWSTAASGGAWTKITETVVGLAATSITLSSVPATYRHLRLVIMGRGDNAALQTQFNVQFNGDTASNYNHYTVAYQQTGPTASETSGGSSGETAMIVSKLPGGTATANWAGAAEILIADYRGALFKSVTMMGGDMDTNASQGGNSNIRSTNGIWASTAAITSIKILTAAGNFVVGTTATLYGMT